MEDTEKNEGGGVEDTEKNEEEEWRTRRRMRWRRGGH